MPNPPREKRPGGYGGEAKPNRIAPKPLPFGQRPQPTPEAKSLGKLAAKERREWYTVTVTEAIEIARLDRQPMAMIKGVSHLMDRDPDVGPVSKQLELSGREGGSPIKNDITITFRKPTVTPGEDA